MKNSISLRFEQYEKEMLSELVKLVNLKSLPNREKRPGFLTSDEIEETLCYTLELAERLGFKTFNVDNEYGYAEMGEGEKTIGIFTHLDVVSPGNGWTRDPFDCVVEDGKIYGRGVLDNKSPLITCLYGMKTLKDLGIEPKCKIRIIFGTCEETGMADIIRYVEENGSPDASFVPDSQFPLAYCEKGVLFLKLFKDGKAEDKRFLLTKLEGGSMRNMVADSAVAELVVADEQSAKNVVALLTDYVRERNIKMSAYAENNVVRFISEGIPGHANEPHKGKNAVIQLVSFLNTLGINDGRGDILRFVADKMSCSYDGQELGIKTSCESGDLVFNLSIMKLNDDGAEFTINIRYPAEASEQKILTNLTEVLNDCNTSIVSKDVLPAVLLDKDSAIVQLLYRNYQEITEDFAPMKSCGATYAKYIKNAVPYGAIFTEEYDKCHHADEFVRVEDMMLAGKIYCTALYEIVNGIESL